MKTVNHLNRYFLLAVILALGLLTGCARVEQREQSLPAAESSPDDQPLTDEEIDTLISLEKLDDHPLYVMHYAGDHLLPQVSGLVSSAEWARTDSSVDPNLSWGCTLFAALGDPDSRLFGRSFEWRYSPAVLVFTDPTEGYASVSMVDIEYLGFGNEDLTQLPLEKRAALLFASVIPFDGMNETGLAIGMAAVPSGNMKKDPLKKTIDELGAIREVLDHAATVDEAIEILASYNIDMGDVPIHYLVATKAGDSALVEFYRGKMMVLRNENPWQVATNFLVSATNGHPQGSCRRYDLVTKGLQEAKGMIDIEAAMDFLQEVSQDSPSDVADTQWSMVYEMTSGGVNIVMDRQFDGEIYELTLDLLK